MTAKEERYGQLKELVRQDWLDDQLCFCCLPAVEKVALLIGNQQYESMGQLISPENDVLELTKLLQGLNFKVFSLVNLRYSEMMEALDIFYEMLAVPGVYALFYYSGHGFSHNKTNYLTPVDATTCEHSIVSDKISDLMQKTMSQAFVILDCCRIGIKYVGSSRTSL